MIIEKEKNGSVSYRGYCIDLLNELVRILKFTYEIYEVPDGNYGTEMENGTWNGMIGELMKQVCGGRRAWTCFVLRINKAVWLNCYLKKWKMKINIKKTKIIVFNRSGKVCKGQKFKIGKQILITDGYVYLGITFTSSGSFSLAQQKLSNKATRSLYSFLSEINIYKGASVATILKLFDSLVNPILLYNC